MNANIRSIGVAATSFNWLSNVVYFNISRCSSTQPFLTCVLIQNRCNVNTGRLVSPLLLANALSSRRQSEASNQSPK